MSVTIICLMHRHWLFLRVTLAWTPSRRWHQIFSSRLMPSHFAIGLFKVTKPAPELPFYFYDIPSMTGVMVETDAFLEIAKECLPSFVGVKFTNQDYDLLQRCMANTPVKADMLFGTDERLIEGLGFGCVGAVGSTYNFASPLYLRIINAFNREDMESANEDQARSLQMIKRMYQSGFRCRLQGSDGLCRC